MDQKLSAIVDATLAGSHDFEDAWRQLGEAIDAAPDAVEPRRLRVRLAQAANLREEQLTDLRELCRIDPRDRESNLQLALRLFAWQKAEGAQRSAADQAAKARSRLVQLRALLKTLGTRADRLARGLDLWDSLMIWEPWSRLQIALHAVTLHPQDAALRRHLALSWGELVQQPPAVDTPDGLPPLGFALDATGALSDALIAPRALAALDAALEQSPGDADLLNDRAIVSQGLSRFAEAEAYFAAAARAWDRRIEVGKLTALELAQARAMADLAYGRAQRCSGGRETLSRPWMAVDGDPNSPDTLFTMPTLPGIERSPPPAVGDRRQPPLPEVDDASRLQSRLAEKAGIVVEQLAGLLAPTPGDWREIAAPPPGALPAEWPLLAAAMDRAGLPALGWAENPAVRDDRHQAAPCHVWCSKDGSVTVAAVAYGGAIGVEIATGYADGSHQVTTNARGRTCMAGGPRVDTLHADAVLPLDSLLALHQARVALRRAEQPDLQVSTVHSFADFAAAQRSQHAGEAAHRQACGLDDYEALAVPTDWPELFAPLLQAAAKEWVGRRASR